MTKKRRVINSKFIILVSATLLILILIYKIPNFIITQNLKALGFDETAIEAIRDKGLINEILNNDYYSAYLNDEIKKENFKEDYLAYYVISDDLNEDRFALIERLKELYAYSEEELLKLYASLSHKECTPLLVFGKVDVDAYIEDLKDGQTDENYLKEEAFTPENIEAIDLYLPNNANVGDYKPLKLAPMNVNYASKNLFLESKALEAFYDLVDQMRTEDLSIYAVEAYKEEANITDQKLGLSLKVVSLENESLANFESTNAYMWMQAHAHEFGFIERFTNEAITGVTSMPYYWRYVGVDLATSLKESNLTFDEYYYMYLKK